MDKQQGLQLLEDLRAKERQLYVKGEDKQRLELLRSIKNIEKILGIETVTGDTCESCT